MKFAPLPPYRLTAGITSVCVLEWLLFELLRVPYRPPQDMTTFLGTEKYTVIAFITLLAVISFAWGAWLILRRTWTRQDVLFVMAVVVSLSLSVGLAVLLPSWPVTPWQMILR